MVNRNGVLIILYLFMVLGGIFYTIDAHEKAHLQIWADNGVSSTIQYFPNGFWNSPVAWTNATSSTESCDQQCYDLHALNEIVFYNVQGLEIFLAIVGLFILLVVAINN